MPPRERSGTRPCEGQAPTGLPSVRVTTTVEERGGSRQILAVLPLDDAVRFIDEEARP